jgi:hypothetical protein
MGVLSYSAPSARKLARGGRNPHLSKTGRTASESALALSEIHTYNPLIRHTGYRLGLIGIREVPQYSVPLAAAAKLEDILDVSQCARGKIVDFL